MPQQSNRNKINQSIFKEDVHNIQTQIEKEYDFDFVYEKISEFFKENLELGDNKIAGIIADELKKKKIYNIETEPYLLLAEDLQYSEPSIRRLFNETQKTVKRKHFNRIIIMAGIDSVTADKLLWNMIKVKNQVNVSYRDKEDIFIRTVTRSINRFEKEYHLIAAVDKRIIANKLAVKNGIKCPFVEEDEEAQ